MMASFRSTTSRPPRNTFFVSITNNITNIMIITINTTKIISISITIINITSSHISILLLLVLEVIQGQLIASIFSDGERRGLGLVQERPTTRP